MFKNILLATDGGVQAQKLAKRAIDIAKGQSDTQITLVYVLDPKTTKYDLLGHGSKTAVQFARTKRLKATEYQLYKEDLSFEPIILKGDPANSLIQYINDHDFDLVIVGSRGLNAVQEAVLGSVSHKVAKHAKCPVLIVK